MTTVLQTLASSYPVTDPLTTSWVSMNAEEVVEVSDSFDVSAVPYLVLTRNKEVLDNVSGSDAAKVRAAIEKHANNVSAGSNGVSAAILNGTAPKKADSSSNGPEGTTTAAPLPEDPAKSKEDLHKRLSELVKAAPVMLFMKGVPGAPQCGFSRQLVAMLREKSVKYGFFNILADDEVRQGLKEFADWPTFPQLWVDGELVGGLDIVSYPCVARHGSFTFAELTTVSRSRKKLQTIPISSSHIASPKPLVRRQPPLSKLLQPPLHKEK
jgi:Grx4 family monothiol glutaredoxin